MAALPTPTLFLPAAYEQTLKLFPINCHYDIKAEDALTYTMITDPCNPVEDLDGTCRTSGVAGKLRLTCQKPEEMVFHGHHPSTGN